jgi:hypothetical protein
VIRRYELSISTPPHRPRAACEVQALAKQASAAAADKWTGHRPRPRITAAVPRTPSANYRSNSATYQSRSHARCVVRRCVGRRHRRACHRDARRSRMRAGRRRLFHCTKQADTPNHVTVQTGRRCATYPPRGRKAISAMRWATSHYRSASRLPSTSTDDGIRHDPARAG